MSNTPSLKERIRRGDTLIGVSAPVNATRDQLEAILSKDSYDFIFADSQHSAYNEERLVSFCATAEELGMPVQFRIKHTRHTYLIGNILDLGPLGIEVPQVELESTVDEALDNFYYPQLGKRSWGGPMRYGFKGREDRLTYADWWNNTGILCMQIESIQAATNARQLAKSGVDCLTWGPADLTFDIEAHPEHPFKTVDDCLQHVLKQLAGTNTRVSFRSYSPDLRNKYLDMGVTILMEAPKP
ncbi:MAG: aldolase/citrate lyase family protein [Chloroflexota bacterium]